MSKFATLLIAASAAFAAPAFAQNDAGILLRVDSGTVLSSTGGEYQAANTGKPLTVGEKLMVNAGSSATAVFEGGCTVQFSEPVTASSVSVVLKDGGGTTVPATLTYDAGTRTASLKPNAALKEGTTYTVTVSGATDAAPGRWRRG